MQAEGGRRTRAFGGYQPGLDGVRALAVLGVLAYHAGFGWATGGYLGVSLFFTLSGFLITGILLDQLRRTDAIALGDFWTRRFRRLAPASLIGLVMAVAYGATLADRSQADGLPAEITGALLYVANWVFIGTEQSYADLFAAPSPVQHYWSLAIEEQFYLVVPLGLLLVARRPSGRRFLPAVTAATAVVAALWPIWRHQAGDSFDRLYYGTDTRMAELFVGVLLAVVLDRVGHEVAARRAGPWAVVGVLAAGGLGWGWARVGLDDPRLWQGGLLVASLLAAAVIMSILGGRGPVAALCRWPPLVWIGRRSYGIYVYHWFVFLWLTEARTDLDRVPLFAVRLAVTVALADLSLRFVEGPIRQGATVVGARWRLAAYPVAAAVVLAGAVLLIDEDAGPDRFATIREGDETIIPVAAPDGVVDVVVIADAGQADVVARLEAIAADADELTVTVGAPFACSGGLVAVEGGTTCAGWAEEWPTLVADHDPDVVLLLADDWMGTPLTELDGRPPGEPRDVARALLEPALASLGTRGASVVWATSGADFTVDLQRSFQPFTQAMREIELARDDVEAVLGGRIPDRARFDPEAYADAAAEVLLDDLALYQRGDRPGARVLVVGDSQGRSLGYGLERWGADTGTAWVWNVGSLGCGIADEGVTVADGGESPVRSECVGLVDRWREQVAAFDPEIVVVFTSMWDLAERRLDEWDRSAVIGDPRFDAYLGREYDEAVEAFAANGATVVWVQAPCAELDGGLGTVSVPDALSRERLDALDRELLPALAARHPGRVALFDLDAVLCPGGEPMREVDGVGVLRSDGIHFSAAGARWFADTHGIELLRLGGLDG